MKFRISKEATKDLESIWHYTAQAWSINQADRYFNLLMDEIEFLSQSPRSGKDISEVREGYFRSNIKSHSIFYRINQHHGAIEIIRILHQRMDINNRLHE